MNKRQFKYPLTSTCHVNSERRALDTWTSGHQVEPHWRCIILCCKNLSCQHWQHCQICVNCEKLVCWKVLPETPLNTRSLIEPSGKLLVFEFVEFWAHLYKYKNAIPVGCVPPAHYRMGGLCLGDSPLDRDPPGQRPPGQRSPRRRAPWKETPGQRPPDRDPLWTETPSGQKLPLDRDPLWTETPSGQRPLSHLTCGTCWDRDPPLWRESQTGVKHYLAATSL